MGPEDNKAVTYTITVELTAENLEDILRWQSCASAAYFQDESYEEDEATLEVIRAAQNQL